MASYRRFITHTLGIPALLGLVGCLAALPVAATPFIFNNGDVDGRMATASRPATPGAFEIEAADDFVVTSPVQINHARFTGLLTGGAVPANISQVLAEIYRVFPKDSDLTRTPNVPTRANSPSDVALTGRDSAASGLTFSTTILNSNFTAANSVQAGGIHSAPNQTTGGDGPLTGIEVLFDVIFSSSIDLAPDHYFFVPQVALGSGAFLWLSSTRPIVAPGTPFTPDLQAWTRDQALDPDWLRVGTDIVGGSPAPTFNLAFSLDGQAVPEPSTASLMVLAMLVLVRRTLRTRLKPLSPATVLPARRAPRCWRSSGSACLPRR